MPRHFPLPSFDHKPKPFIQPQSTVIPLKCSNLYPVKVGVAETPIHYPLYSFRSVAFALVSLHDVDADLRMSVVCYTWLQRSKVDYTDGCRLRLA